jgi:alpha-ketoglutaric semialdehyde dehydrogenase
MQSRSPHQPSDVVADFDECGPADVDAATVTARAAQADWAAQPPAVRSAALDAAAAAIAAAADELTDLLVREVGKPRGEAAGEVARTVAILCYYAQQAYDPLGAVYPPSSGAGLSYTRRRPRGVAGLVTPWNFPLAIPIWKAAPALAFGNAVLLKPAPQATRCAQQLAALLAPHLPDGLLHVLPGDADAGAAVVAAADVVSFTGSAAVGGQVAAAVVGRGRPVQCEMGGQNPAVVLPDADVGAAAGQIAAAAFGFAGQKCTATKRVVVTGDVAAFTEALVAATEKLTVGDPADPATMVGPVIEEAARTQVLAAADSARAAGGRIVAGGTRRDEPGWFLAPTIVDRLPAGHHLLCEEVFGPICAIVAADSAEHAVAIANDVRYGLVASVHTGDLDHALRFAEALTAGQIKVNAPTTGVDFYLPFGGEGASSIGPREQGKAAYDFYTSLHTVALNPSGR